MKNFGIIAALLILLITSCNDRKANPLKEDTIHINLGTEPPTLDWSLATDSTSFLVINNIMEGLTQFGDGLKPEPALAKSWDISEDGRTITFHLREEVVWTDGEPLEAEDFEYSWKRLLDPKTGADYAYFLYDIEGAEGYNTGKNDDPESLGVKAQDEHTLVVKLKRPASYFFSLLTFMSTFPLRKDVLEKYGENWTDPGNIVTLGPYNLSEWRHHDRVILTGNPKYRGEKPRLGRVDMIMSENPTSSLALYEAGELDFIDERSIPPLEVPRLRLLPEFETAPQFRGNYVGFNVKKEPFNNPLVRRAFSAAIDRSKLCEIIQGQGIPTTSWIPKGMLGYNPNVGIGFNPEQAKRWLAEAGYQNGSGFPRVVFMYPDRGNNRLVAETIQSLWKKYLGVEVQLENQEWKVFLKTLDVDPPPVFRLGWGADFPDPHNFMNLFECTSGNNETGWCNPEYDRVVEEAAEEKDPKKERNSTEKPRRY